jgi:hypothetical protein
MSLNDSAEKKLNDIYLAVCGNRELGVPGLVDKVDHHEQRIIDLEAVKSGGLTIWKGVVWVCVALGGLAFFVSNALDIIHKLQ